MQYQILHVYNVCEQSQFYLLKFWGSLHLSFQHLRQACDPFGLTKFLDSEMVTLIAKCVSTGHCFVRDSDSPNRAPKPSIRARKRGGIGLLNFSTSSGLMTRRLPPPPTINKAIFSLDMERGGGVNQIPPINHHQWIYFRVQGVKMTVVT